MKLYNYTFEDCYKQFLNQQFERLKKELIFYETKGIKTKIILFCPLVCLLSLLR